MSGNAERIGMFQCPKCIELGCKTTEWSIFYGSSDSGNWDRFVISRKRRLRRFLNNYVGKRVTRIKCLTKTSHEKDRHNIERGEHLVFDRVMKALEFEDGVICE